MKKKLLAIVAAVLVGGPMAASALPITSRAALQSLLGGPGALEDFESFAPPSGGATAVVCNTANVLDSTSICDGQGPGLVDTNIRLLKDGGGFQWDSAGYFGATSREFLIGAPPDQPLVLDFVSAVGAFGLDLRAFSGFGAVATMTIFGVDDATVLGTISGISLGEDGLSVFSGWEDSSGIGSVSLSQTGQQWSPIVDNLEWGSAIAVPEPGTLALFSLGLAGLGFARRRRAN